MNILIIGGAGFVGSTLAKAFRTEGHKVSTFDNLRRRGSEMNLALFKQLGIQFLHGDIRSKEDLFQSRSEIQGSLDLIVDAAAEPSVLAGLHGGSDYLLNTNLNGSIHCLELAKKESCPIIFLSTSRVYSIQALQNIQLHEQEGRFAIKDTQTQPGISSKGVDETFSTSSFKSLYGASKFCSEVLCQEYSSLFGVPVVINRCGVLAGPGQFGKVDQGVFTLWLMNHIFRKGLTYTGFGAKGLQVRDLLHPLDLFDLMKKQLKETSSWKADIYNVGGGVEVSVSLKELTTFCEQITGNKIEIAQNFETSPVDIPLYVSDSTKAQNRFQWKPERKIKTILSEIHDWVLKNEAAVKLLSNI